MKTLFYVTIVTLLVLTGLGLAACGGSSQTTTGAQTTPATSQPPSSSTTNKPQTTTPASTTPSQTTTTSGGSDIFGDMPVYPGAGQIQQGSWAIPPTEGDYAKFEWRYYESSGSVSDVAGYYRSEMPSKGWDEQGWLDVQGTSWGFYNKNNENDAAMVWVSSQEGKTVIAMWRATK